MDPAARWEQISELYNAALNLEPSVQGAFLFANSGGGADICEEVKRMLSFSPPPDFLEDRHPLQALLQTGDSVDSVKPGEILAGRFEVVRFIGKGGMGEVYEAYDSELHEPIAIKMLRADVAGDEATIARFKLEIQLSRRIAHPNVCNVFDLARHDWDSEEGESAFFLTMELVEGTTLSEHLRDSGPLPAKEAEDIIRQVGAGLQAAHDVGIIHRDLKAANIMIAPNGTSGRRAVLMDFGLARRVAADTSDGPAPPWSLAGTPLYMAPEQLSGGELTAASDIFAFGIVIHEILTGVRPHGRESLTQMLVDPSAVLGTPGPQTTGLNRRAARVILRCLEADPAARFSSAREAVGELFDPRWTHLTRREMAVSMTALAALGTAAAVWAPRLLHGPRIDPDADAMFQKGRLHARRLTVEDLLKAVTYFRQAIQRQPNFALAYAGLADAYSTLNDYGGMPHWEAINSALAAARRGVELAPKLTEAQSSLGLALSNHVRLWRRAEPSFQRAIALNPAYGPAHQGYAAWLSRLQRMREAIREMKAAVAADPVSLPISVVLGWTYFFDRQYDASLAQGLRTVDLDPNFRYGYLLVARSYAALGKLKEAVAACERGVQLSGNASVFASALACIKFLGGETGSALAVAQTLEKRRAAENFAASHIASVYAMCGRNNEAFRWLYYGFEDGDCTVLLVRVYPQYDPIRTDPRYAKLLSDFSLA